MAIATAHLRGERELVDALARDHLVDHPDSVLVAWIADASHAPDLDHEGGAMNPKLTASLLILAAVLANVGVHRARLDLQLPRRARRAGRRGARLLPRRTRARSARGSPSSRCPPRCSRPIAIGVGRLSSARAMRIAVPVGIAAAVVQVVGLLRWPILVPGYASDAASANAAVAADARDSFTTASDILGTAIGETLGYLLTATWTVLVIVALGRRFAGRWFPVLGARRPRRSSSSASSRRSACPVIDTANFLGYVLWSVWLIAFARRDPRPRAARRRRAGVRAGRR